jgi:hypothetical protein
MVTPAALFDSRCGSGYGPCSFCFPHAFFLSSNATTDLKRMRCDAKCKRESLTPHQAAACFSRRRQRRVVAAVAMGTASWLDGQATQELLFAATVAAATRAARKARGRRRGARAACGPRPLLPRVERDGACTTTNRARFRGAFVAGGAGEARWGTLEGRVECDLPVPVRCGPCGVCGSLCLSPPSSREGARAC